ncbi:MAG: hypothetical protein V7K94_29925 [Nostoc sp.]|uniref:hypothetical protein n=1 Tax=Nostoc sp. TaxID=1180 RepID=UPI002FF45F0C
MICNSFNYRSVSLSWVQRRRSPPQSILSLIAESPADVGYWSDEWRVGGKSGAKIGFTSSFMLMHY